VAGGGGWVARAREHRHRRSTTHSHLLKCVTASILLDFISLIATRKKFLTATCVTDLEISLKTLSDGINFT
jgi:hypothetical protein